MTFDGSCFMVTWIVFKKHLLEVGLTQDQETMAFRNPTTIILIYSIMCKDPAARTNISLKQHLVEGAVTCVQATVGLNFIIYRQRGSQGQYWIDIQVNGWYRSVIGKTFQHNWLTSYQCLQVQLVDILRFYLIKPVYSIDSSYMICSFPTVLNFNKLFLKLNQFNCH